MKKVVVIGSGFSGLSAATFMAEAGWDVTVLEKHNMPGGRARRFTEAGFTFDMGPSWYWMPDVFERYFRQFGKEVKDYYQLDRLDPSYRVYWKNEWADIPAAPDKLTRLFESIETGSGDKLEKFLSEAAFKYEAGINKLVYKPGRSLHEFFDLDLLKGVLKLDVFTSMSKHVRKFFKDPRLIQLLEFPVLFLGALPEKIPALYSLMNYADMKLGTWYPQGGIYSVVDAMYNLAVERGVNFQFNTEVKKIQVEDGEAKGVYALSENNNTLFFNSDIVIGAADYHFIESELLDEKFRSYSEGYWEQRTMAPSCLIYYIGLNKKLSNITHHTLFFDSDFARHGEDIYGNQQWPENPLFYVCAPSVTDSSVAPDGCENLFFLIPVAAGLSGDTPGLRETYFENILKRFEVRCGEKIAGSIIYKKTYSVSDFVNDYNAYKGNAYGLANTLLQTSILKPSLKSRKVKNLYYSGQLTVPGPGVPPALISGEVVSKEINREFYINKTKGYDPVIS